MTRAATTLFGAPALARRRPTAPEAEPSRPTVSAVATGSFEMGPGPLTVEVDVLAAGLVFTVLVRAGRVVGPMHRGERAVRFTDRRLAADAHRAAIEAAQDALRRGWLA